ncbi:MAG: signal peptidase I [bacterium]
MKWYFIFFEPILKWLEKPEAVISLSILFIIIRIIYVKFRSKKIVAEEQKGKKDWRLEVIDICIIAMILVFGIVWNFLLKTYYIPSGSMVPTMEITDRLIANRFVYNFHSPRRGDVVVFTPPKEAIIYNNQLYSLRQWLSDSLDTPDALKADELRITAGYLNEINDRPQDFHLTQNILNTSVDPNSVTQKELVDAMVRPVFKDEYIKRVIAVAGDKVKIVSGYSDASGIYVNGTKQTLTEKNDLMFENQHRINGICPSFMDLPKKNVVVKRPQLSEYSGNGSEFLADLSIWIGKSVLYNKSIQPLVQGDYIVIPKDCIFVMGDNRTEGGSFDSRYWGVVPLKSVKARAVAIFWPISDVKTL